ncbi:protein PFC0760c-like [Microplitis demolitor]|uniref:protein PFC0760c-like n=1 Tax=Microplitis demolitor TaxID=69319 RepID=UPI0004CDAB7F|nr:protein PFC0760c-like [Microplitis demolitor]
MSKWWETINKFRGRKGEQQKNEISANQWVEHFEKLLNRDDGAIDDEEDETEPWCGEGEDLESVDPRLDEIYMVREVRMTLRKLGNNKVAGEDGIAAEFLKNVSQDVETDQSADTSFHNKNDSVVEPRLNNVYETDRSDGTDEEYSNRDEKKSNESKEEDSDDDDNEDIDCLNKNNTEEEKNDI